MSPVTVCLLSMVLLLTLCECQSNYESPYDPVSGRDVDSFQVNEWQRYLNFHRKKMKNVFNSIRKRKKKAKTVKSKSENRKVAPNFILSRTQDGFVVKQLEPGSDLTGKGGFEFPKQPALMTNVKFKYDGSVAPVVKLSETDKGVVGKRLEYGFSQNPGINWQGRSVTSKYLKSKIIDAKGQINKLAGVSEKFPEGWISVRGTLRMLNYTTQIEPTDIREIEPIPPDEDYEVETERYNEGDETFEITDTYYNIPDDNSDDFDDDNSDDDNPDSNYFFTGDE